jgi:hypothetical protein
VLSMKFYEIFIEVLIRKVLWGGFESQNTASEENYSSRALYDTKARVYSKDKKGSFFVNKEW